MKVGVALPHYGKPPSLDRVVEIAKECERLGFDSVWVSDHVVFDLAKYGGSDELIGSLEPLTTLAVLSRETTRLRLGTMVLNNELREPVQLAKEAANIPRLELGLGAGWYEREFAVAGLPFRPVGERIARLGEAVVTVRRVFAEDTLRLGVPVPPIWVGGKGDRMVAMIAELGVGWNAAWFQDVDAYRERAEKLGGSDVPRSIGQYARGSAQEMVDRLASFEREGVSHAIMCFSDVPFGLDDADDLARFAQDVLPHVH